MVTQNVDRLHHKAGSMNVIELHGSGYIVKCLNCPYEIDRFKLQDILMKNNPSMKSSFDMIRPDGDVELSKVSLSVKSTSIYTAASYNTCFFFKGDETLFYNET